MDIDPDFYSIGINKDEKKYTSQYPFHYIINKNGDLYTYRASSYQNVKQVKMIPLLLTI